LDFSKRHPIRVIFEIGQVIGEAGFDELQRAKDFQRADMMLLSQGGKQVLDLCQKIIEVSGRGVHLPHYTASSLMVIVQEILYLSSLAIDEPHRDE